MANKQDIQTLKGFRDFLGAEMRQRLWLIGEIRQTFERFGFEPLESPVLEYEALLAGKYGAEADKLMYRFEDRGGRRVAMRYDQTVPAARIIAQYQGQLTFPYRKYQIQLAWRADKPQKGRYREFLQCDADIIGSSSPIADADILGVYSAIYKNIGLTSLKINLNDRAQLIQSIQNSGVTEAMIFPVIQTVDKLDKKGAEAVIQELTEKGLSADIAKSVLDNLGKSQPTDNLKRIIELATKLGVPDGVLQFNPNLARGLDYYTGMIFEGIIPEYEVGAVGGGGRYDELINKLVGADYPAVGFGLGFDRTLEVAVQLGKVPAMKSNSTVLITMASPEILDDSLRITQQLRQSGIAAETITEGNLPLEKQLKYADRKGIPYVIIVSPEELKNNRVLLKNMQSGDQESLTIEAISAKLLHEH